MQVKSFLDRIRTRALWVSVGTVATVLGVMVLTAAPVLPVVAAALVGWGLVVNTIAKKWEPSRCYGCGDSIADAPVGGHGTICPGCGAVNEVIEIAGPEVKPRAPFDDLV
jgi:hypothetical protein